MPNDDAANGDFRSVALRGSPRVGGRQVRQGSCAALGVVMVKNDVGPENLPDPTNVVVSPRGLEPRTR